jgi:hypothetical protein
MLSRMSCRNARVRLVIERVGSIVVRLTRAKRDEVQARFDMRHIQRETELGRKLARFCDDNRERLAAIDLGRIGIDLVRNCATGLHGSCNGYAEQPSLKLGSSARLNLDSLALAQTPAGARHQLESDIPEGPVGCRGQ